METTRATHFDNLPTSAMQSSPSVHCLANCFLEGLGSYHHHWEDLQIVLDLCFLPGCQAIPHHNYNV